MDNNEARIRIAELAASLTKLEIEKYPQNFRTTQLIDESFVKHFDTIISKVAE